MISNADIKKVKNKGRNVELYFNLQGARKWAEMTKNNVGKQIAITIDDVIYSLPQIETEIKNGMALLVGLESEKIAMEIAEALNLSSQN